MDCAKEMGCEESIVRFVMPLGTTVNMNGTALYEATTVIFLAQVRLLILLQGQLWAEYPNPQCDIEVQRLLATPFSTSSSSFLVTDLIGMRACRDSNMLGGDKQQATHVRGPIVGHPVLSPALLCFRRMEWLWAWVARSW